MNLKDVEWDPEPTDPRLIRKVRAAVKGCVSTHDVSRLRAFLLSDPINGAIPHEVRGSVWLLLLNLRAEDLLAGDANEFARAASQAVSDDNSREQIEKDVTRTRPSLQRFKQPAVRGALLRLLSLFCSRRKVAYVQGFNELLAPFVLLADTGGTPRLVYALFDEFVSRFAPWMLDSSESRVFDVLKRAFKYFGRLLLYHDPELFWLLERNMMTPDLYATPWFVTLFARNFTVECVLALWDLLLLEDNPLGTSFFGIAMLTKRREELLGADPSRLPETLMMLTAKSPDEIRKLWRIGSEMRVSNTPPSFQRLMTDRLLNSSANPTPTSLSAARAMQASVCLQTTPDDLVAGDTQFFTWDCRTQAEFHAGHLAQAAYLPLDAVRTAHEGGSAEIGDGARNELQHAVDLCQPLAKNSHICLVGSGVREEDDTDINIVALYLTEMGIPYVSTLRGGFRFALQTFQSDDGLGSVELADYDLSKHQRARKLRESLRTKATQRDIKQQNGSSGASGSGSASGKDDYDILANTPTGGDRQEFPGFAAAALPSLSSFLEKTDAEVSRALNRALSGIGFRGQTLFGGETEVEGSPQSKDGRREPSVFSPAGSSTSADPFPPDSLVSPAPAAYIPKENRTPKTSPSGEDSSSTPRLPEIRRSMSSSTGPIHRAFLESPNSEKSWMKDGFVSADNSPRFVESLGSGISPRPGVQLGASTSDVGSPPRQGVGQKAPSSPRTSSKSPWGRDATPGWLSDDSLSFPLSLMPKGFTVNVMDDRVMAGLRLFPCRARSDRSLKLRGSKSSEFPRRYVGVCKNYFLLLSPHKDRNHLLEVKVIRYLQDIARITFKRSRPELVTFEIAMEGGETAPRENVVCIMPDGLKECVQVIKQYLVLPDQEPATPEGCANPESSFRERNIEDQSLDIPTPIATSRKVTVPRPPPPLPSPLVERDVRPNSKVDASGASDVSNSSLDEFQGFQGAEPVSLISDLQVSNFPKQVPKAANTKFYP